MDGHMFDDLFKAIGIFIIIVAIIAFLIGKFFG